MRKYFLLPFVMISLLMAFGCGSDEPATDNSALPPGQTTADQSKPANPDNANSNKVEAPL